MTTRLIEVDVSEIERHYGLKAIDSVLLKCTCTRKDDHGQEIEIVAGWHVPFEIRDPYTFQLSPEVRKALAAQGEGEK